ncbi:hypothetical protein CK203_115515 [Vitis vinifera]|uniref:Threonyl/alanyl tRNA synthetase SAD domain-containing protein n=1 Tax=Vitis vinifera TaxID=29760 RepID=A0A438F7C4_VITVI|nr:hypothetical protein CK203_115515 [Vitis vinifera]
MDLIGVKLKEVEEEKNQKAPLSWAFARHMYADCGLGNLEPGKGYHFPDGPFVEYKGVVPQNELQGKQKELELDANALISRGGKVSAVVLPYAEAVELCGGCLPDYIPKSSNPRILKLGDNPGCPCGGTHVSDISEIISVKVIHMC